jgi:AcrR family transcriptional regulator
MGWEMSRRTAAKAMTQKEVQAETLPVIDGDAAPARQRILDAAQRVFADFGYDGASMRQIADAAGVPVALVSYHFGSKDGLYRAVFYRRVPAIVDQRHAGIAIAMSEPDLDRRLELLVKVLVMPWLRMRARDKDPSLGRLLAHESIDPNAEARGIIRDLFDPVAREILAALASALPGRSVADVAWAYQFMLGAMVYVMSDAGRIARLSEGRSHPDDEEAAVAHMVAFLTAGIRFGTPVRASASVGERAARMPKYNKGVGKVRKPHAIGDFSKGRRTAKGRRISR